MSMANAIANFGMNAGRDIQNTVSNALAKKENQKRYENSLALQKEDQAIQQRQLDATETERKEAAAKAFTVGAVTAWHSASGDPQKQAMIAQGAIQKGLTSGVWDQDDVSLLQNPDGWLKLSGMVGVGLPGADKANSPYSKIDPSDYDPESIAAFNKSGNYADLKPVSGGGFAGTGVEQQMLNIILDQNIPDNHPKKILARQRLGRPTTTVTPDGTYTQPGYDLGLLGGQSDGGSIPAFTEKPATDGEKLSSGFYNRMVEAEKNIANLGGYNPSDPIETLKGVTNITASPNFQLYRQAADDWIRSKLRKESGAVIGEDEMKKEYETYFPQVGDSPQVIAQKYRARQTASKAMRSSAGRAYKEPEAISPEVDADLLQYMTPEERALFNGSNR